MKPAGHTPLPPRRKSRGVAVLELALSLIFLVPLLMGMLDFGYYFYISSNAEEAAHAGVREAVLRQGGAVCAAAATATTVAEVIAPANVNGSACNNSSAGFGGDAACYLHQAPIGLGGLPGGPTGGTTVTATCSALPVNPTWTVRVQVDFKLAYGALRLFFPQSIAPGCTDCVVYAATASGSP